MSSNEPLPDTTVSEHWNRLQRDDRHSTIDHLREYISVGETELLVWSGVPVMYAIDPSGKVHTGEESLQKAAEDPEWSSAEGADFEGHEEQSPDDDYQYLIEIIDDEGGIETILCTDLDEVYSQIRDNVKDPSNHPENLEDSNLTMHDPLHDRSDRTLEPGDVKSPISVIEEWDNHPPSKLQSVVDALKSVF